MITTVVTTFRNTHAALALMRESFILHHGSGHDWFVIDDASEDGASGYAVARAARYTRNRAQENFGRGLDRLVKMVETPYVLTVDSDVEFFADTLTPMLEMIGDGFCVADTHTTGDCCIAGWPLKGQKKLDHSVALWDTKKLQEVLKHVSFEVYIAPTLSEYLDGGAMVLRGALLRGETIIETNRHWETTIHYGGLASHFVENVEPVAKAATARRYAVVERRLEALRRGEQSWDGLVRSGDRWITVNG